MLEALHAERIKLARHKVTWFTVWIFPIGLTVLFLAATAWVVVRGSPPEIGPPETAADWIRDTAMPWIGARLTMARYLLAAFTAVAFGGEYGWNTWKLVAPHRPRTTLMAAKYIIVLGLIATALVLMGLLSVVLSWAAGPLIDDPAPAGVRLADLLAVHGREATKTLMAVLLTMAYAGAGAVLTRSALAGAIIGVVAVTAEGLVGQFAPLLKPWLVEVLPAYHFRNLSFWTDNGRMLEQPTAGRVIAHTWSVSLAALAAWTGGLVALSVAAFRRQDLN